MHGYPAGEGKRERCEHGDTPVAHHGAHQRGKNQYAAGCDQKHQHAAGADRLRHRRVKGRRIGRGRNRRQRPGVQQAEAVQELKPQLCR